MGGGVGLPAKAAWVTSAAAHSSVRARSVEPRSVVGVHALACSPAEDSLKAGHQTGDSWRIVSQVRLVTSAATGEFANGFVFIVVVVWFCFLGFRGISIIRHSDGPALSIFFEPEELLHAGGEVRVRTRRAEAVS